MSTKSSEWNKQPSVESGKLPPRFLRLVFGPLWICVEVKEAFCAMVEVGGHPMISSIHRLLPQQKNDTQRFAESSHHSNNLSSELPNLLESKDLLLCLTLFP